jgi:glycosyltransferase involved in cell wall biosynthesis
LVGGTKQENPRAVPEETLRAWEDAGVVEWMGRRDDMPVVLRDSDVVCLPTFYGEGVPKILLEAAACGRAIIASDSPGCREVVRDGVNGLLVDPTDTSSLVNALEVLIRDRELREKMGRAGAELAAQSFDVNQVVARTIAVYESLLANNPNRV